MSKEYSLLEKDIETITTLWSTTYNTDGKPDWSHIFPYYHEDITFQDSIQTIHGKDDFLKMTKRLTKRSKSLEMKLHNVMKDGHVIVMEWTMTMRFRIFPNTSMYGMTRLTLHEDGRIMEQRDYYDLWGDIYDNVPIFKHLYRWFMRRFFG
jgi:limonene-1,2-epoxide hydrolase